MGEQSLSIVTPPGMADEQMVTEEIEKLKAKGVGAAAAVSKLADLLGFIKSMSNSQSEALEAARDQVSAHRSTYFSVRICQN